MVSVEFAFVWFFTSLLILIITLAILIIYLNIFNIPFFKKSPIIFNSITIVLSIIAIFLLGLNYLPVVLLIGFIIIVYHPLRLFLPLEKILIKFPIIYRIKILQSLLNENSTITTSNFFKYFLSIFTAEFYNFSDISLKTIRDVQVGIFNSEFTPTISMKLLDSFRLQQKYFKYKKLSEPTIELIETEEDFLKLHTFWKKARNPNLNFVHVSRLPWKFKNLSNTNNFFKIFTSNILIVYNFTKTTIIPVLLMIIYFLYTIFFFKIQFLKQISVWFVIGMIYFWLISGFNFFLKRYQFGKFTSQIQRFWKRTNMCFWLIEGFLILIFFYYFLNSSQEPLYMYDYSSLNQEYLISLETITTNIILLSLIIYLMYFTILRVNSNSWQQLNLYLIIISSFIFFSFFIETYQFYYIISTFNERTWFFNEEENLWCLDIEAPILRVKQDYLLVCLIAKYWHFLFIFLSWVFFLIKSFEKKKITFVLFGANLQNIILLYVLNFACYLQWSKWLYRRFFDLPYTWFMTNIDNKFIVKLFLEIKLSITSLFKLDIVTNSYPIFYKSIVLWNVDSLAIWKFI